MPWTPNLFRNIENPLMIAVNNTKSTPFFISFNKVRSFKKIMVKIHCLGSEYDKDGEALKFVGKTLEGFKFVTYDGTFEKRMLVMDVVKGIEKVQVLGLDAFLTRQAVTVHDFDAGMELMLRKEVGDIEKVKVICLPYGKKVSPDEISEVLRKI